MIYHDTNRSWIPPHDTNPDFICTSVKGEGGFLRVEYRRILRTPDNIVRGREVIVVYLNHMGREVGRTMEKDLWDAPKKRVVPVLTLWQRIQLWIETLILDTEEIFTWPKK